MQREQVVLMEDERREITTILLIISFERFSTALKYQIYLQSDFWPCRATV